MSTKTNLWIDILIFISFLIAYEIRLTGIPIHEWLSIALTLVIVLHLAAHWDWVVQVGKRFFHKLFHASRLDFVVDIVFFIAFVLVMVSGIAISRSVLPVLGLQLEAEASWRFIHSWSANISVFALAVHFALHWKWIVSAITRFIVRPIRRKVSSQRLQPAPITAHRDNA
ncbi:MAG: DUF4405 domain-containing protein [Caldilineales bacterium]